MLGIALRAEPPVAAVHAHLEKNSNVVKPLAGVFNGRVAFGGQGKLWAGPLWRLGHGELRDNDLLLQPFQCIMNHCGRDTVTKRALYQRENLLLGGLLSQSKNGYQDDFIADSGDFRHAQPIVPAPLA